MCSLQIEQGACHTANINEALQNKQINVKKN